MTAPHGFPGLPAVISEQIYLAAGITDQDEEAEIDDPDEEAAVGDPREIATIGDPGKSRVSDFGISLVIHRSGEMRWKNSRFFFR